jgi:ABC-type lipoprotein export system ATPase subunit
MTAAAIVATDVFCLYSVPGGATVAALRGLTLRVPTGERLIVHGPNGSGKTTLLRLLLGEVSPSAGSVVVDGVELAGASARRLSILRRHTLGIVDQHATRTLRPELDVLDNIGLQLRVAGRSRTGARDEAAKLLSALGISELAGRRTSVLSGGEAQRVAVCAAVAHRPAVILADEPSGELDVASGEAVYDLLATAAAHVGATLVLVTHDVRAARIGDRVVRIRDGRLSEQWRPGAGADEELVVDSRGWVRLPETARRRAGLGEQVTVSDTGAGLVISSRDGAPPGPPPSLTPLPAPDRSAAQPLAAASGLGLTYGERTVFAGFDLSLAGPGLTVVQGRSGAGKSTLLRLLLGLADPDDGTVTLGGQELAALDRAARAALRRQVAAVSMQAGALGESLDAAENLALARAARGQAADAAAVATVLSALRLDVVAGRPVRLLSGGERQRVALARSLVVRRPLVVLDEPTSQQDEAHAELVTAVLRGAAAAGAAVLAASHDPVLVAAADAVVALT